jgi:hypothetical protein
MRPNIFGRVQRAIGALLAAIVSLVASYTVFRWVFIKYWEWQHDGRPMKFTFWADERALPLAFVVSGVVFYTIFSYFQRRLPANEQLRRSSLVVLTVAAVVLLFLCAVAYVFYIVRQFGR